jgi:hypothetical protein
MQGIIDLHHDIFFFLILILVFILLKVGPQWILLQMRRGGLRTRGQLTAGASSSTAGGDDEKEKEKLRKKCQRRGVIWCKQYFEKYHIMNPKPESFDWMLFSDKVLQETFDYHNGDSAGLNSLLNLINYQSGNRGFCWPAEAASHDIYHAIKKILESGSSF